MESMVVNLIVTGVIIGSYMLGFSRTGPLEGAIICGIITASSNIALNIYIEKIKASKTKNTRS